MRLKPQKEWKYYIPFFLLSLKNATRNKNCDAATYMISKWLLAISMVKWPDPINLSSNSKHMQTVVPWSISTSFVSLCEYLLLEHTLPNLSLLKSSGTYQGQNFQIERWRNRTGVIKSSWEELALIDFYLGTVASKNIKKQEI